MQGGNKARRWQSEQTEEREKDRGRGKRSKVRVVVVGVGVAVLLNFNEYQGEFLLHIFFPFLPFHFFSLGCTHLQHSSISLSHK